MVSRLRSFAASGAQLRHDDPLALKQIVQSVRDVQAGGNPADLRFACCPLFYFADGNSLKRHSSRERFLSESLANLKNNRVQQRTGVIADSVGQIRKALQSLSKQRQSASRLPKSKRLLIPRLSSGPVPEPLRLSLDDIRSSISKGKWWLLTAGWTGDPLTDSAVHSAQADTGVPPDDQQVWLSIARQQGMNTDVRRNIFAALMASEVCKSSSQPALTSLLKPEDDGRTMRTPVIDWESWGSKKGSSVRSCASYSIVAAT